jgi:hypothetical protein
MRLCEQLLRALAELVDLHLQRLALVRVRDLRTIGSRQRRRSKCEGQAKADRLHVDGVLVGEVVEDIVGLLGSNALPPPRVRKQPQQ